MPETLVPAAVSIDVYRPLQDRVQSRIWRLADDTRGLLRRVYSAPLGLAWQLDVTVVLDAEVVADDRDTAAQLFQQHLRRADARIVVSCPSDGPIGWREIAFAPVTRLCDVAVEDNTDVDAGWPWSVAAATTVRFTVPARDADAELCLHIDPDPCHSIQRISAAPRRVTRTPVRRHGKHR